MPTILRSTVIIIFKEESLELTTKTDCRGRFSYIHGNVIPALSSKVTNWSKTILRSIFLS